MRFALRGDGDLRRHPGQLVPGPGWRRGLRYWDGMTWTEQVVPPGAPVSAALRILGARRHGRVPSSAGRPTAGPSPSRASLGARALDWLLW